MEKALLIKELKMTEKGLDTTYDFKPEEYIGAVFNYDKSYLVSRRDGDVVFKPCVIDASVELTPKGPKTKAEFYFYTETFGTPETSAMLESINQTGRLPNDLGFTQDWDFTAYAVSDMNLFGEIMEMKSIYPDRSVRDAFEMKTLRAEVEERHK